MGTPNVCKGRESNKLVCPQRGMNLDGFLNALEDFPDKMVGAPVEALACLWNRKLSQVVDMIAPSHAHPEVGVQRALWFTEELCAVKQLE